MHWETRTVSWSPLLTVVRLANPARFVTVGICTSNESNNCNSAHIGDIKRGCNNHLQQREIESCAVQTVYCYITTSSIIDPARSFGLKQLGQHEDYVWQAWNCT